MGMRARAVLTAVVTLAATAASLVGAAPAHAATTYTWRTDIPFSDNQWATAGNWQPAGVPGNGDSVVIADTASFEAIVLGVPTVQLVNLTLVGQAGSGTKVSGGAITITGAFNMTDNADLDSSSITINAGATATFTGSGGDDVPTLAGADTIVNNGTMRFHGTASVFDFGGDDQLVNNAATEIEIGSTLAGNGCCVNTGALVNNGTVSLTPGSGTNTKFDDLAFDNNATLTIPSGQTVKLLAHPNTFGTGATVAGGGRLLLSDSTTTAALVLGDDLTLGGGSVLELGGTATLDGGGHHLTGSGSVRWKGGTITGALTVDASLPVAITTSSTKTLTDATLETDGTTTFSGGQLHFDGSTVLNEGTWTVSNAAVFDANTACCSYTNDGTMSIAPETGTPRFSSVDLANTGTLYGGGQGTAGELSVPNFSQVTPGKLSIDVNGLASFDDVAVTDTADLGGTLVIKTDPGFQPAVGDTFMVMTWASHTGKFNKVAGAYLGAGRRYMVSYLAGGLRLRVVKQSILLSPTSGPPNTSVKVTGKAFGPHESVAVTFKDHNGVVTNFPAATTSAVGIFTKTIAVPAGAVVGGATVKATGATSGLIAMKAFTVT
jgi:hypothetical protein